MAQPSTVERTTMTPTPRPEEFDWRAEYAYTAGVQAFIYGFRTSTTPSFGTTG